MNTAGLKKKINQKYYAVFAGLILVLVLAGILALCVGRYWVPFPDVVKVLLSRVFPVSGSWDANTESVVMTLRPVSYTHLQCLPGAVKGILKPIGLYEYFFLQRWERTVVKTCHGSQRCAGNECRLPLFFPHDSPDALLTALSRTHCPLKVINL